MLPKSSKQKSALFILAPSMCPKEWLQKYVFCVTLYFIVLEFYYFVFHEFYNESSRVSNYEKQPFQHQAENAWSKWVSKLLLLVFVYMANGAIDERYIHKRVK